MKLGEILKARANVEDNNQNNKKEVYNKLCLEHWENNKESILDYLATCSKEQNNIFISYSILFKTPFSNIPIFADATMAYDDMNPGSIDCFNLYLKAVGIDFTIRGSSFFSTTDENYAQKNGILINLNSEIK